MPNHSESLGPADHRDYSRLAETAFDRARVRGLNAVVVGAGALGNEVIKNLALLGIGHLTIIDRDVVEASNLTRSVLFCTPDIAAGIRDRVPKAHLAAARACEINPDVFASAIVAEAADVGLGCLRRADLVFSCVDNEMTRLELGWACSRLDRLLIDGGLGRFNYSSGQVSVFPGSDGPCYACRKTTARRRQMLQEMHGREDPCWIREDVAEDAGGVATTPLMASAIGAIQVEMGVRSIAGVEPRTRGLALTLTLHPVPELRQSRFERSATCPLHEPESLIRSICELDARSEECTAARILRLANVDDGVLRLDWPVVAEAGCRGCGAVWEPFVRRAVFRRAACPSCGSSNITDRIVLTAVEPDSKWLDRPLTSLGQPKEHIYEVVGPAGDVCRHVEIVGDPRATEERVLQPC